jgi:hypothetical protein
MRIQDLVWGSNVCKLMLVGMYMLYLVQVAVEEPPALQHPWL